MKIDHCPKCGEPGYLYVVCFKRELKTGEEVEYCYWRIEHYYKDGNGRRRKKVHYYGPYGRKYIRVEGVVELGLASPLHQDFATVVFNAVSRFINTTRIKLRRGGHSQGGGLGGGKKIARDPRRGAEGPKGV
jgi:hypothetical protein